MSVVDSLALPPALVDAYHRATGPVLALFGAGAPASPQGPQDRIERTRRPGGERPALRVAPSAPGQSLTQPAINPHLRIDLETTRRQSEELYRRAVEQIAADICGYRANRVAYARAVLESLRDPDAEDGRGDMAADVYQRIEPATEHTPPNERQGRLTPEERTLLGVKPAELPEAAQPGVGGPDWSRSLASFNASRIDVELPSGATDYFSYKPYRFGTARTIETIKRVGERYHQATGLLLRVGDIAARGGGRIPDHASHNTGNIFDLDLSFNDGRSTAEPDRDSVNATWRSPAYDRNNTRRLIQMIKAIRPEAQILFNDPVLIREGLTTHFPNHDNHMHVQRLS